MLNSQFAKDLKAGMPPTAEEITAAQNDLANKIRAKELYFLPTGQPGNEPQVTAKIQDQAKKLPEQMRQKVADTSKVYIQPNTFEPYTAILQAQGAPAPVPSRRRDSRYGKASARALPKSSARTLGS